MRRHQSQPCFAPFFKTIHSKEWLRHGFVFGCAALFFFLSILSPSWADEAAHTAWSNNATIDMLFGLSVGVMLTASLYLFFIWIVIRDRSQAYLIFFLLCLCANMASTNDLLMNALKIQSGAMRDLLQSYSLILSYIASLLFTHAFLDIDTNAPAMRLPLFGMAVVMFLLLGLAAINQQWLFFALPTLGAIALSLVMGAGLYAFSIGITGSFSHILAFTFFMAGGLATPLHQIGYLPDIQTAIRLGNMSNAFAALMFAIVIAGQFAARQDEKERALAISNERFSLAVKGSNEGLFDWNRQTGEVYISELCQKIIGRTMANTGKGLRAWLYAIGPQDRAAVLSALRAFRDNTSAHTLNLEYRIVLSDHTLRWIHTKAIAVRHTQTGKVIRFVGSVADITSRKRGESALKASEARFRSITEAHPVPVLIARLADLQIVYASPGAENMFGLPTGVLISNRLDRFIAKAAERQDLITSMTEGREVNLVELSLSRADGNDFPAEISARRINYQNEPAMVIGLNDLSERKEAQAKIAMQQEALLQSEKMAALGSLLAGVAHELNNPLSVVMGQTTLMMETTEDEKIQKRADKIFKAADRCARIVKSFLAIARRKEPERKPMDLNAVIQAALELLSYQFRNEAVALHLELDPSIPPVVGDSDQMTQVFTNLALNAAQAFHDFTGLHDLTIRTSCDGEHVIARLIDTGPGIPPALHSRIFEPFFSTKIGHGGTGVGLSLCLNIIGSHGGTLVQEDTPGGGATFTVFLPLAQAEQDSDEGGAPTDEVLAQGPKRRLLLVDDEVELAQTLADLLEPAGFDIDLAANGEIALEKLRKTPFDAIVSDLRMPVLDGPGLFEELAKSLPHYTKRIIFVTGDTLSPHVNRFLSDNPVPVIEKPYRTVDVKKALAALFSANETNDEGPSSSSST